MLKNFVYGNWIEDQDTAEFKTTLNKMTKEELLKEISNSVVEEENNMARNRMGCSESIYNGYYDVACLFTEEQLNKMSREELINVIFTAQEVAMMLY